MSRYPSGKLTRPLRDSQVFQWQINLGVIRIEIICNKNKIASWYVQMGEKLAWWNPLFPLMTNDDTCIWTTSHARVIGSWSISDVLLRTEQVYYDRYSYYVIDKYKLITVLVVNAYCVWLPWGWWWWFSSHTMSGLLKVKKRTWLSKILVEVSASMMISC